MNSLGEAIKILHQQQNTYVEILSRKMTPKRDDPEQRIVVKFV